jgi:hypothetical protein
MHRGGRGDARASCASPLGTPLIRCKTKNKLAYQPDHSVKAKIGATLKRNTEKSLPEYDIAKVSDEELPTLRILKPSQE